MAFIRRDIIRGGLAAGAGLAAAGMAGSAFANIPGFNSVRKISLLNLHTGESLSTAYWEAGGYVSDALQAVNKVLRDHRTGDVHDIDPGLLDLMTAMSLKLEASKPFQIISGYRSPHTNGALASKSSGVATRSLHMDGKAVDLRLPGVPLVNVRDTALALKLGGVGYYPDSSNNFVHVDTGRVRRW